MDVSQPPLKSSWNSCMQKRENLKKYVAKFSYGCGILFNVAKSCDFQNMLIHIAYYCLKYAIMGHEKLETKEIFTDVKSNLIQDLEGIKSSSGQIIQVALLFAMDEQT